MAEVRYVTWEVEGWRWDGDVPKGMEKREAARMSLLAVCLVDLRLSVYALYCIVIVIDYSYRILLPACFMLHVECDMLRGTFQPKISRNKGHHAHIRL